MPAADDDFSEIEDYDYEELLASLGQELVGQSVGLGPADFGRYVDLARRWLNDHLAEIRAAVCGNIAVKAVQSEDYDNMLATASVLADVLQEMKGHVPTTTLGMLLARAGIQRVCSDSDFQF